MAKMQQARTDYGTKGETGEREPKGAAAADRGQRKVAVPVADSQKGTEGYTREKYPANAKASDSGGERKAKMAGGVGMGKADDLGQRSDSHAGRPDGRVGEFNHGKNDSVVYKHQRHKLGFTHKG
jgi:hypothetical protein